VVLRWGLLGTGAIARVFAEAVQTSASSELAAVASRRRVTAESFAAAWPGCAAHGSYQVLLEDPAVEAVYIATPHPQHTEWTIRALEAGKHVLCEKPLGLNHAAVMASLDAARQSKRFLMEAFMYRCHPQTLRLIELIRSGAIGTPGLVSASFGFSATPDPDSRLFNPALGGGAILDMGCYPVSMARLIAGAEPIAVAGHGRLGETGVDEWAAAQLAFADGSSAQVATGITLELANTLDVYGTEGCIHVPAPWLCREDWHFDLIRGDATERISGQAGPLYVLQLDHVAGQIENGALESPLMSWEDSRGNAAALDDWRAGVGLIYEPEQPERHAGPLLGELRQAPALARPGHIKHLSKPVSRLVMGCDNQPGIAHAAVMWDNFLSLGGNCFDTAYIYGQGAMESLLGYWHRARNIREALVIIGKGAHSPQNLPAFVTPQLDESLGRLQTDYLDLYFLHRDNPDVEVGEFVDAVNDEIRRGRIRAWGGSNWTLERIQAANEYARSRGLQGMSAVSNNFSLARMIQPLWPGVESATDQPFRDCLTDEDVALLPWSSQARGFFTPWAEQVMAQAGRDARTITSVEPTQAELARTWFSPDNFERRRRAVALAAERGVEPIQIALAYVINQPFACFPLIGPRQIVETRSSMAALEIPLSEAECAWLDLSE
jgi:predicted dehydrogenase/aryl-alcohol dehydrogenase-like predicted oxidoreductase